MLGSVLKDIFGASNSAAPKQAPMPQGSTIAQLRQGDGGHVICFITPSEGGALGELINGLMRPLKDRAKRILLIDYGQPDWQTQLQEAFSEPIWFATSFFGSGQEILVHDQSNANAWEAAGIPFVRFYGDIPAYFPDRHVMRFRNSINAYFHQSHASYHRRWFQDPALSVLLPPVMFDPMPLSDVDRKAKLTGKIIFPKNGNSPDQLIAYWRQALPPLLCKALENLGEELVSRDWIDREPCLDDRLVAYFEAFGVDISTEKAALCFLVAQLDDYLRRVKSTMIAESLLDLPVIVRGRHWDHVDFRGKRAIHDPDPDMARTLGLIDQAPAIVDMSPNTQFAPHDRICRAVGRGTAFLSNRQEFLNGLLPAPERFTFSFEKEAIHNCVEQYVDRPELAIDLGIEQANSFRKQFSEEAFTQSLLLAVQMCALRMGGRPGGTQQFVDFPPRLFH